MGKQRALYFEVVDQYLAELGFLFSYLPEPKNIIFHNNPKELVIVDTWLGKINFPQDRSIDIDLLIQIVDWNFLTLPKVFIKGPLSPELEVLIGLAHFLPMPYYIPNNDQSDYYLNICYSLHSEISLPRSHPEELMKWVINQCHKLFDESLNDFSVRDADIKRDLGVMWDQISRILWGSELNFAMDRVHEISSISDRLANTPNDIDAINLRDHYEIELYQRYRSLHLGWLMYIHEIELPKNGMKLHKDYVKWKCTDENKNKEALTFFLIVNTNESSNVLPSLEVFSKRIFAYQKKLNEDRLITHLNSEPLLRLIDLLFWLKEWDKKTLSAWKFIFYDLFKGEEVWPYTELFCCLVIDNIPLAFCLNFPEKLDLFASYKSISGEINKLRNLNYLSNLSSIKLLPQIGVVPVVSQNLTTKFVFNRNLEGMKQENLTARTIVVIGVGAIGGYLTHSLARLGAGAEHGELILIDTDDLSESNIGRHILGQNYIKKSKVMALKEQLEIELPQLNIKVFNQGVETLLGYRSNDFDLSQADIIFDATAKAGIGEILSEWRRDLAFPQPCMIHVWIRDNGECVQALLNTPSKELKPQFACRSCLQIAGGKFLPQYDALPGHEPKIAYAACSDFTPYAVSASMSAAALATDMVLDYVNDENSPRYRTRYTERWSGAKLASTDATVALDCPCCFGI